MGIKIVRIWNLPIECLDRQHLLGEHVETHVIFNAIMKERRGEKAGWQHHPQTIRFKDNLMALVDRHDQQVREMARRGYQHQSPLDLVNYQKVQFTYTAREMVDDLRDLIQRKGVKFK